MIKTLQDKGNADLPMAVAEPLGVGNGFAFFHKEDPDQRTALLAALQAITTALAAPLETVFKANAASRSAIIGFTGAVISTTINNAIITLTTAPPAGSGGLVLGQAITAAGIPAGTTLQGLASGTLNAVGSTYTLSTVATASGTSIAATSAGPQQLMPANTNRRGFAIQNQSKTDGNDCYINGQALAAKDHTSLLIGPGGFYDGSATHVGTGAISIIATAPATPVYAREW